LSYEVVVIRQFVIICVIALRRHLANTFRTTRLGSRRRSTCYWGSRLARRSCGQEQQRHCWTD